MPACQFWLVLPWQQSIVILQGYQTISLSLFLKKKLLSSILCFLSECVCLCETHSSTSDTHEGNPLLFHYSLFSNKLYHFIVSTHYLCFPLFLFYSVGKFSVASCVFRSHIFRKLFTFVFSLFCRTQRFWSLHLFLFIILYICLSVCLSLHLFVFSLSTLESLFILFILS